MTDDKLSASAAQTAAKAQNNPFEPSGKTDTKTDSRWTSKGKPKDGWYYEGECPRCGPGQQVVQIGSGKGFVVCRGCNQTDGVTITEQPEQQEV